MQGLVRYLCILLLWTAPVWSAAASAAGSADYTHTRYPIVLVHGMGGFDTVFGVLRYWSDIPDKLRQGGATVYTVQLSPMDSNQRRGEQLLAQLQSLQAVYGYTRFNMIAHSQGGTSARYVAEIRPDLVASLTTLGSPHRGSRVADGLSAGAPEGSLQGEILKAVLQAIGQLESVASGAGLRPQNFEAAMHDLTTAQMDDFNHRYPSGAPRTPCGEGPELAANGVRYYSFGGTAVLTHPLDILDPALGLTSLFFDGEANDGLVSRCSAHWGRVVRDDYPWNHLDEINQIFGLRGLFSPDPAEVLRVHVNRLKLAGI